MNTALDTLVDTDSSDVVTVYIDEARANGLTPMP